MAAGLATQIVRVSDIEDGLSLVQFLGAIALVSMNLSETKTEPNQIL